MGKGVKSFRKNREKRLTITFWCVIMARLCKNAAIAQPVERILGKDEVASSNLASSSKNPVHESGRDFYFLLLTFSLLPQNKIHTGFLGSDK